MSRAATPHRQPQPVVVATLPGLPRAPLTAEQQVTALKRVQEQADQRLKLGAQFFKAAEARTGEYRQILDQLKAEQETLRGQMQQDVSKSFHTYDQWIGQVEEGFTTALHGLESKIDRLQTEWAKTQQRIDTMMKRSEAMLDQCRTMLETPPIPPAPVSGTASTLRGLTVVAREAPAIPVATPIHTPRPATTPLVERPAPQVERLHQSPPPVPAFEMPPLPADSINERPASGNAITDAIASTDGDIESPEFYRQVLEKLREQDETMP